MADVEPIDLHSQVPIDEVPSRKVTVNCAYETCCQDIVRNLNELELQKMEELTPFGALIRWGNGFTRYNQVIWYLFACQVPLHLINREELLMIVNRKPLRYSIAEFALISGLKCTGDDEDFPNTSGEFEATYFSDTACTYNSIKRIFNGMPRTVERDPNPWKIKMAGLYFVVAAILPLYRKDSGINIKWLSFFDDLDRCREFPWGKVSFSMSVNSWKMNVAASLDQKTCNVSGLLFPLQLFAFECITGLAAKLGAVRSDREDVTPRFLNWSVASKVPNYEDVRNYVRNCEDVVFRLTPSSIERSMPYFTPYEAMDGTMSALIDDIFISGRSVLCKDAPPCYNSDSPRPSKKRKSRSSKKPVKSSKDQTFLINEMQREIDKLNGRVDMITKILADISCEFFVKLYSRRERNYR